MQVKDLKAKQGNVDIIVDIVDVGQAREFDKFGKTGRVATAIAKDETGDVKLSLWNEQVDKVKPGDKVHITNGYVSEWQGELQLTTGKMGKLEIIGESEKTIKEETSAPDEEKDRKIFKESEEKLDDIEEDSDEKMEYDEEDIEDE
jgi:replication factor A1